MQWIYCLKLGLCWEKNITKFRPRGKESTEVVNAIFVVCSQTFTRFRLIKTAVPVKISRYSFRVFACAWPSVISSIPGKSFHFPFP